MPARELERLVQFCHPEKILEATRLAGRLTPDDRLLGALYGTSPRRYRALVSSFERTARAVAAELLGRPGFRAAAESLPVPREGTVLAAGDSITDDRQSWAEILRHVLAETHGARLVNGGLSGDTTTGLVSRLGRLPPADLVVILIGTNDARRHGRADGEMLVSHAETARNLGVLRRVRQPVVWITPPPVSEAWIAGAEELIEADVAWRGRDVTAKAELVRRLPDPVVDLWPAWTADLLLDDGLHPNLAGQRRILEAVVGHFARAKRSSIQAIA